MQAAVMIQNALVEEGCAILRCHASSLHCDSQNALVKKCAIPALPCMQAAVMIHKTLVEESVLSLPCSSLLL
jgi:hypothetical protein